jgi:hypothetical protein
MRTTRKRATAAVMVAGALAAVTLALPGAAGAADAGGEQWVDPGGTFALSGGDCIFDGSPGRLVVMVQANGDNPLVYDPLRTTADAEGHWNVAVPIPATTEPDFYLVRIACKGDGQGKGLGDVTLHLRKPAPPAGPAAPDAPAPQTPADPAMAPPAPENAPGRARAPRTPRSPGTAAPVAVRATPQFTG